MKTRHAMVAALLILTAGCGSTTINTTPKTTTTVDASNDKGTTTPSNDTGQDDETPETTQPAKTAGVGDTVGTKNGSDPIDVTLVKLIDPAQYNDEYNTPEEGKRVIGLQIRVTNTGTNDIDVPIGSAMTIKDADGQSFSDQWYELKDCPEFAGQMATLAAGESGLGCIAFEVPEAAKLASATFSSDLGSSNARWDLTIGN